MKKKIAIEGLFESPCHKKLAFNTSFRNFGTPSSTHNRTLTIDFDILLLSHTHFVRKLYCGADLIAPSLLTSTQIGKSNLLNLYLAAFEYYLGIPKSSSATMKINEFTSKTTR